MNTIKFDKILIKKNELKLEMVINHIISSEYNNTRIEIITFNYYII